jgi:hypothetical protein
MIKFFRKIRQNLLSDGKTGKYLKYAIGEIVLVMIGILLALQVNEWNKERVRKIAEQTTIEQLIADLSRSQYQLEEEKEDNVRKAREAAQVLRVFSMSELPDDIEDYALDNFGSTVYSPVMGTVQSLINSGNLDILSSKALKNNIVEYAEAVGYHLKNINRYEESYFRKGVDLMFEAIPNTTESLEAINERGQRDLTGWQYKNNINKRPVTSDKVPFKTDLQELFKDVRYFRAKDHMHLYHRNISNKYDDILEITNKLLVELYKASNKYPNLGEQLAMSDHYLVFDEADLEILERTDALLSDSSEWKKNTNWNCDDDITSEKYSLLCALKTASEQVVGTWEDDPLRPAIRLVLLTLKKYENRRVIGSLIREWNDHPDTTFEELKTVLKESIKEVNKQLN